MDTEKTETDHNIPGRSCPYCHVEMVEVEKWNSWAMCSDCLSLLVFTEDLLFRKPIEVDFDEMFTSPTLRRMIDYVRDARLLAILQQGRTNAH